VRKNKPALRRKTPGPKPSITLAVVKRVATRIGRGLTLNLALAAENKSTINEETWKKALQAHPEFSPHYEAGKGKFLDWAMQRLAVSKELANLKWLLERRHPDLFARPAEVAVNVNNTTNISGLPDDVLERARVIARNQAKAPNEGK
jgi:hypothetical protein